MISYHERQTEDRKALGDDGFMRSVLDALSAHVAVLDDEGVIVATNAAWRRYAEENELPLEAFEKGTNYLAACDRAAAAGCDDGVDLIAREIRSVMNGEKDVSTTEYAVQTARGTCWFTLRVNRLGEQDPFRILVAHENITSQRLAEEARRQSLERLEALFDNTYDAILLAGDDGRYVDVNPAACTLLGYSRDELLTRSVWDLTPGGNREHGEALWKAFVETGYQTGQYVLCCKDGTLIDVEYQATADILPGLHLSILRNVTARNKVEQALRRKQAQLELVERIAVKANEAESIEEAMQFTVDAVCAFTGWPVGHVLLLAEDGTGELVSTKIWHGGEGSFAALRHITEATRFVPGKGMPGAVFTTGQPQWIMNVQGDPGYVRAQQVHDLGVRTTFAFPVLVGQKVVAALEFFSTEEVEPDPLFMEAVSVIGTQLGRVVERHWAKVQQQLLLMQAEGERRRLRAVLDVLPVGVFISDAEGRLLEANPAARKIWGRDVPLVDASQYDVYKGWQAGSDQRIKAHEWGLARALKDGKAVMHEEVDIETFDGDRKSILSYSKPIWNGAGRITGGVAAHIDVTFLKQVQQELKALNADLEARVAERTAQVRALTKALTLAEQRERRRLSQVLHDDLQQVLFGLDMRATLLGKEVPRGQVALQEQVGQLRAIIRRAVETARTLALELNPPVLRGEGLQASLAWLARHMEEHHHLQVEMAVTADRTVRGEDQRVLLVQFVRELLLNVAQHAGTHQARVIAHPTEDAFMVRIEDDGVGFDAEQAVQVHAHQDSLGLYSIAERLRLFGGRLDIDTAPGRGSRITIRIPLEV